VDGWVAGHRFLVLTQVVQVTQRELVCAFVVGGGCRRDTISGGRVYRIRLTRPGWYGKRIRRVKRASAGEKHRIIVILGDQLDRSGQRRVNSDSWFLMVCRACAIRPFKRDLRPVTIKMEAPPTAKDYCQQQHNYTRSHLLGRQVVCPLLFFQEPENDGTIVSPAELKVKERTQRG
jgi:hypothetical protein